MINILQLNAKKDNFFRLRLSFRRSSLLLVILLVISSTINIFYLTTGKTTIISSITVNKSAEQKSIAVLYSTMDDYNYIQLMINTDNISLSFYDISELSFMNRPPVSVDGAILISREPFSDQFNIIGSYLTSLVNENKSVILFTPFISSIFESTLRSWDIGYNFDLLPEEGSEYNFSVRLTEVSKTILEMEDNFETTFIGKIAKTDATISDDNILLSVSEINSNLTNYPTLPIPIIYTSANNPNLLVMDFYSLNMTETLVKTGSNELIETITINTLVNKKINQNQLSFTDIIITITDLFLLGQFMTNTMSDSFTTFNGDSNTNTNTNTTNLLIMNPLLQFMNYLPLIIVPLLFLIVIIKRTEIIQIIRKLLDKLLLITIPVGYVISKAVSRRLETEDIFDNQIRRDIINFLEHKEGNWAYFNELKTKLQLGTGQLLWHLQILNDFGIVGTLKVDDYKIYYIRGSSLDINKIKIMMALKSPKSQSIIKILLNEDDFIQTTFIAKRANCHRKTVTEHLKKLEKLELVESLKQGRSRLFKVKEDEKGFINNILSELTKYN